MDLDHMLNGSNSRRHHQDMIRQAQRDRLAQYVLSARRRNDNGSSARALLNAVSFLVMKI